MPTPSPPFEVGVFVVFYSYSSNSGTTSQWKGMGGKESFISPFDVGKTSGPLGQSVSSNVVTDCSSKMSNLVQSTPVIDLIDV